MPWLVKGHGGLTLQIAVTFYLTNSVQGLVCKKYQFNTLKYVTMGLSWPAVKL